MQNAIPIASKLYRDAIPIAPRSYVRDAISIAPRLYMRSQLHLSPTWDNCIDGIIILDNNHRFKEDPEYGQMLKRMWNGDLTTEDCKRINSRVIGYNGLQLPSNREGDFKKRKFQN